jgi:DNA-binding NarL/FixJ family response regulator
MKRIAIIEDHPIISAGLQQIILANWKNCEVDRFDQILEFEKKFDSKNRYDLIIADIHLRGFNTVDWLILQKIKFPNQFIVIYSGSHPWELSLSKQNFPFDGYVQKNSSIQTLMECISQLKEHSPYLPEHLEWERPNILEYQRVTLTKREKEILTLMKLGKTNKEIADMLFLSELTIKSHRQNMMRKFDARNIAELISKSNSKEYQ